jgi:nucleoside-diphosphate-sugar epimerase
MKIAVTGGSGAIGAYVCDELGRAGHDVLCLDIVAPRNKIAFLEVDLANLEDTCRAVQGCEQIVHLAAIPDPYGGDSPEKIIGLNTVLSYNLFEAARLTHVRRVIYGCSESSTGFGIHHARLLPLYAPIDEEHPLWPHETYSLSKYFGERIAACYAKAFDLEAISLRYTWVWTRKARKQAQEIVNQSRTGVVPQEINGFGAHIAVRDVARACAAAAAFEFSPAQVPFEAFFLAARNTFYPAPTLDILDAYCAGQRPPLRDPAYFEENPYASVFDIRKAKKLLGWEPQLDWRDFEQWEL